MKESADVFAFPHTLLVFICICRQRQEAFRKSKTCTNLHAHTHDFTFSVRSVVEVKSQMKIDDYSYGKERVELKKYVGIRHA